MQYDEFVEKVQERAHIQERADAEEIIRTTLETLGERLYRTEKDKLAAQLPVELKEALMLRGEPGPTRRDVDQFTLEEFYNRISARLETGFPQAQKQAGAVLAVLKEALPGAMIDEALQALPEEFRTLFY